MATHIHSNARDLKREHSGLDVDTDYIPPAYTDAWHAFKADVLRSGLNLVDLCSDIVKTHNPPDLKREPKKGRRRTGPAQPPRKQ